MNQLWHRVYESASIHGSPLSPAGNLSSISTPPCFIGCPTRQGAYQLPILGPLPEGLEGRSGILWVQLDRTPQLLDDPLPLLSRQHLPLLQAIEPGAVLGKGSRGVQMRRGLRQLPRPLGGTLRVLRELGDERRQGIPCAVMG